MRELENNFKELAKSESLSQSYLFFGESEGKFVFAQSLANFLETGDFVEPENFLNEILTVVADEKGSIGIDEIKNLKYFLWQKPAVSPKRVVIVRDAQALTADAQNAALKILEEPPEHGLIIFISKTVDDLLPTLCSRLQKIYFPGTVGLEMKKTKRAKTEIAENETDEFFRDSIAFLMKDSIKNSAKLKEILQRMVLVKRFNTNKKLQLRSLE